jgi:ubiquinone/menaquinone biosynthesis C-methylase UbiE
MPVSPDLIRTDRGPFGLPRGVAGRVAGRLMSINDDQQRELAQLIQLAPEGALCEVGYGPAVLMRLIRSRYPEAALSGANPSAVMLSQAQKSVSAGGDTRRPDLRVAAAADLPFDDCRFDVTIAVNNVVFWPDLGAGLRECRRVTRPGGRVLLAWHGGSKPSWIQRRLLLSDGDLDDIVTAMAAHIGEVERMRMRHSELFATTVPA